MALEMQRTGIHIVFFSKSSKYARWHISPGKILLAHSIRKNGNWTANKWKYYFFIIFTWPVSQYMMSVVVVVSICRKSKYKWKLRPLRLSWRLKGIISLFLLIFGCFSKVLTLSKDILIKAADAIMPHVFADADAVHSISSWQNENWACKSFSVF